MVSNRGIVPIKTPRLGRLQWWLQNRDHSVWQMRLGNLISGYRYWLWRLTGGRHDF